jgi:hypothetical protein
LLYAYFDESGIDPRQPFVAVGGIMATKAKWERIEADWMKELDRFRCKGFPISAFHATECEAGDGEFFGIQKEIRDTWPPRLAKIIEKHSPICIWAAIKRVDWNELTDEAFRQEYPNPFYLCFEWCAEEMVRWQEEVGETTPIALVYSEQKEFEGRVQLIWNAYDRAKKLAPLNSFTTASYKECVPLQAADLVATELYRRRRDNRVPDTMRPAARTLVSAETNFEMIGRLAPSDLRDAVKAFRERRSRKSAGQG